MAEDAEISFGCQNDCLSKPKWLLTKRASFTSEAPRRPCEFLWHANHPPAYAEGQGAPYVVPRCNYPHSPSPHTRRAPNESP
eukprot:5104879-Pyramimonas_sp.AAC.1